MVGYAGWLCRGARTVLVATTIIVALVGGGIAAVAPLYTVASTSMMPTLGEADLVVGSLHDPDWQPQRGDIILYRASGTVYAKRVLGLPGETIAMSNGGVLIDGEPLANRPLAQPIEAGCPQLFAPGAQCRFFRETTPEGRSYVILDSEDDGFLDNFPPVEVPVGHVFVLGDNRDNSLDSRVLDHGPVSLGLVLGKVESILFSTRPGSWPQRLKGFPEHL